MVGHTYIWIRWEESHKMNGRQPPDSLNLCYFTLYCYFKFLNGSVVYFASTPPPFWEGGRIDLPRLIDWVSLTITMKWYLFWVGEWSGEDFLQNSNKNSNKSGGGQEASGRGGFIPRQVRQLPAMARFRRCKGRIWWERRPMMRSMVPWWLLLGGFLPTPVEPEVGSIPLSSPPTGWCTLFTTRQLWANSGIRVSDIRNLLQERGLSSAHPRTGLIQPLFVVLHM